MDRARRRQELSERVDVGLAIGALPWRKPTSGILGLADSSCFMEVSLRERERRLPRFYAQSKPGSTGPGGIRQPVLALFDAK
jgi:hypothetical protein